MRHLDHHQRRLLALVAVRAAGARLGVFVHLDREHAIGDRDAMVQRHPHQALRAAVGDLFVMPGIAAHHAAQRDQSGVPAGGGHARGGERDLPGAGNAEHVDRILGHTVVGERLARAGDQRIGDARVPAAGDDRETRPNGAAQIAFVMGHGAVVGEGWAV